ncbi:mannosyl-oligosaccharide alpha-1,2-mannosidase, partial [Cladochytrium tenue]
MAATTRRSMIERREQELRRKEFQREDLVRELNQEAVFRSNLTSDERVENTRRLRARKLREDEAAAQMALIESERQKQARELQRQEEERIVQEMEHRRAQQLKEEKLRQSIRENSEELRELEKKLNYAYMNKERAVQVQERQLLLLQEKAAEAERIREMNQNLEAQLQRETEKEQARHERSLEYRDALQTQLADSEVRRQQEYELFLREKAMVDDIVRRILEEDE